MNEDIPKQEVLLIDDEGNNLGKMQRDKALDHAYDKGLDLVVVNANSNPLVAKIMDFAKYKFDQSKKLKEMKKNQQTVQVKEIRLSVMIGKHDFDTKLKNADNFISQGNKVKLSIRFKGRMIVHSDQGLEVINKFIDSLGDKIVIESQPKLDGKTISAIVAPSSK